MMLATFRPVFVAYALLCATPLVFVGCDGASGTTDTSDDPRVIAFPPHLYHDADDSTKSYPLRIVNTTDRRISFQTIHSSCGCSKPPLPETPLEPGESTTLEVAINQQGISGMRSVLITLKDDTGTPWDYTINASAYPSLRIEPQQLHFGVMRPGSRDERELVIDTYAPQGDEPLEPRLVAVDHAKVSARLGDSRVEVLNDSVVHLATPVFVTVAAGFDVDQHVAHVDIGDAAVSGGSSSKRNTHRLTVSWSVRSPLRLSPERIFLALDAKGTRAPLQRAVTIARPDGSPFTITGVSASSDAIRAEFHAAASGTWDITIAIDPSRVTDQLTTKLVVQTDCHDAPSVSIPVTVLLLAR